MNWRTPPVLMHPRIDGAFSEWSEEYLLARDAKGDATAAFDITMVAARTAATRPSLHFDLGRELHLQRLWSGEL